MSVSVLAFRSITIQVPSSGAASGAGGVGRRRGDLVHERAVDAAAGVAPAVDPVPGRVAVDRLALLFGEHLDARAGR
jgi:hypothetical protein